MQILVESNDHYARLIVSNAFLEGIDNVVFADKIEFTDTDAAVVAVAGGWLKEPAMSLLH